MGQCHTSWFLQKFDSFWLKKPPSIRSREKSVIIQKLDQVKKERLLDQNKVIFSILDMDSEMTQFLIEHAVKDILIKAMETEETHGIK